MLQTFFLVLCILHLECVLLYQELIQNAEDAQASHVKFLHDKHSHGTAKLHHQDLAQFQVNFVSDVQALHSFLLFLTVTVKNNLLDAVKCNLTQLKTKSVSAFK